MDVIFTRYKKVGNLAIIAEGNIEILKQPLFRVVETFLGKDQVVGSKKTITELVRPIAKLCLLEEGS